MNSMHLFEASTESFVVKIWADDENAPLAWHGQITHVLSGQCQVFHSLKDIEQFMDPYLQKLHPDNEKMFIYRHGATPTLV